MKVVVTGAKGWLGTHLSRRLIGRGDSVIAIDLPLDITKPEGLAAYWDGGDAMVHLAALAAPGYCETHPQETYDVNVRGTYNVLKLAKDAHLKRAIFSSSAHTYGISPKYVPTPEASPVIPQDIYTTTKLLGEDLFRLFYLNYSLPYVTLRQYNGYGPAQSPAYFIPATIEQAKKTGQIVLRGRRVTKDFVYVDDMVSAIVKALDSDYVGELNVGTGVQTSLEHVATHIAEHFNIPLEFAPEEPKGPTQMQCDTSRMEAVFGWVPSITVEEGLTRTLAAADY